MYIRRATQTNRQTGEHVGGTENFNFEKENKMPVTRLFVGGLSDKIDRQDVQKLLSNYGSVCDIDLKEKTDPEGNVLYKFSYVNIDIAPSQVHECIQQTNGASWKGSRLRVELAKESFLDRLKRERAANQHEKQASVSGEPKAKNTASIDLQETGTVKSAVVSNRQQLCSEEASVVGDLEQTGKRKRGRTSSEGVHAESSSDNGLASRNYMKEKKKSTKDHTPRTDVQYAVSKKGLKKNEEEEKILSSFKEFSSVWADSDSETDEEDVHVQDTRRESHRKGQDDKEAGYNRDLKPDKSTHRMREERLPNKHDKNGESDATIDDDADSVQSYKDVREEQQAQLEILANLDGHSNSVTKSLREGSGKAIQRITRYDPNLPEHQHYRVHPTQDQQPVNGTMLAETGKNDKYVKVAKDLNFGQKSSGFSLLAQFSQQNEEEIEVEEVAAAPVRIPKTVAPVQRKAKKKAFFIQADDRQIEAAIGWMTQSLTEEVIREFEEVQPQLREVFTTRAVRVRREQERDSRGRGRGRGQGRGRGRGRGQGQGRGWAASKGTGNPYKDHRWREREIKDKS